MSKLERLIQQYCPDGVEYYKVKDIYKRIKGTPITAGKMKEIANSSGSVRIFAGGKTAIDANEEDIPNATITKVPAVLVQSRGVIDVIYYDKPFTFKNELWGYTTDNKIAVKYLYYVLKNNVQVFRDAASGMGALPQISLKVTEDFEIPVPPLPVQEEIVRILDAFTELQAELQAELQKRKQQYNFYRDNLLNFKDINRGGQEIKWMKMSDVCNSICSGKNRIKKPNGKYPVFGSTGIISYCDKYAFDKTHILVARVGAHAGYVQIASNKYDVSDNTLIIDLRNDIYLNLKYVYYILRYINLNKYAKGGGQPLITAGELKRISIPIPAFSEQNRIVAILDRFDTLTNDLTSGLPAEMEKRRQQYEYYRDRLLTFKRL